MHAQDLTTQVDIIFRAQDCATAAATLNAKGGHAAGGGKRFTNNGTKTLLDDAALNPGRSWPELKKDLTIISDLYNNSVKSNSRLIVNLRHVGLDRDSPDALAVGLGHEAEARSLPKHRSLLQGQSTPGERKV